MNLMRQQRPTTKGLSPPNVSCTGTALELHWKYAIPSQPKSTPTLSCENVTSQSWSCNALELHWNCTETALWLQDSELIQPKFHKVDDCTCSGTALELHWNCTGIAVVTRPKSGGSQNGLMKNSELIQPKFHEVDDWICSGTALELLCD